MEIKEPYTPAEFKQYFHARWEILRKPWDHPEGSEIDNNENISLHAMAVDNEKILGVGRLTYFRSGEGQIRFMGVRNEHQGKQVGKSLLEYLENEARNMGLKKIFLNARENVLDFYKKMGYKSNGKAYEGFAGIMHTKMVKKL